MNFCPKDDVWREYVLGYKQFMQSNIFSELIPLWYSNTKQQAPHTVTQDVFPLKIIPEIKLFVFKSYQTESLLKRRKTGNKNNLD